MGVYWKGIMPLLSTLAALVIIVQSTEEDYEEYRRELRPRTIDTGTTDYELPWRAVKIEPMMTQSTQSDTWDGSPQNPPKRRSPLRKRRRRPQSHPPETSLEQREYRPYNEGYRPLTETPQRRRKKIMPNQKAWNNEPIEKGRPLRRKGFRRKVPDLEPWHELSEFSDIPSDENLDMVEGNQKQEIANYEPEFENNDSHEPRLSLSQLYKEEQNRNPEATGDATEEDNEDDPSQFAVNKENEYEEQIIPQIKEDKSLSEFSLESGNPALITINKNGQGTHFKENLNDVKEQNPLDPISLKEILKKSNGKSLSELLQQHNLTLADLLNGQKEVLSVLKSTDILEHNKELIGVQNATTQISIIEARETSTSIKPNTFERVMEELNDDNNKFYEITSSDSSSSTTNSYFIKESVDSTVVAPKSSLSAIDKYNLNTDASSTINQSDKMKVNETNTSFLRRRLPIGVRTKLRMRPLVNNSYKGQLSRDLIALNNKRYQNNRNLTKLKEWKDFIPAIMNKMRIKDANDEKMDIGEEIDNITTTKMPEETTTTQVILQTNVNTESESETQTEIKNTNPIPTTTISSTETTTEMEATTTLKPIISTKLSQRLNMTSLRQQAFANRLRRKKLKQKLSTNDTSQDHTLKDIFGMANLVSASEFIAKIHPKPTTLSDETERVTMLEDFMTTETSTIAVAQRSTKRSRTREKPKSSTTMVPTLQAITTETAKIEIEEILNDTLASVRLSKILMERNMTFDELVEHRERGSSHVHLADIFHNASKEPNPPEPFLSKSLIEPISKETYPLRALLEANSHNSTIKPTTVEPYLLSPHYINIPITMDFGNNVNENGESTGITALFNNFTKTVEKINNNEADNTNKDVEESDINLANSTSRQGRVIGNEQDLVTLNEIFSLMQKSQNLTDESLAFTNEIGSEEKSVTDTALEDIDGDGLIALEDLQHIKHFKQNTDFISGNVEHDILESLKVTPTISIPEIIHSNTRSITVVTASIVGLIAVLFLLTYAAFKWKNQQQVYQRKQCIAEERIPTPVFENRKSNKNSSMRSMSPMLSSNIYSVNTLEKPKNNNCPEYMWDCTRNPFQ